MPIEQKTAFADQVLDNSGLLEEVEAKVEELVAQLRRDAGWTWIVAWILPPVGLLLAARSLLFRAIRTRRSRKKRA